MSVEAQPGGAAAADAGTRGEVILEVTDLVKHFPVRAGLFKRQDVKKVGESTVFFAKDAQGFRRDFRQRTHRPFFEVRFENLRNVQIGR